VVREHREQFVAELGRARAGLAHEALALLARQGHGRRENRPQAREVEGLGHSA
jgi:hypothetical protein